MNTDAAKIESGISVIYGSLDPVFCSKSGLLRLPIMHQTLAMRLKHEVESEELIQRRIVAYLRYYYPKLPFVGSLGGIRLTRGLATKAVSLGNTKGWPDLNIAASRCGYCGLYLELKRAGTRVYTRDGRPVNPHIAKQHEILVALRKEGYFAEFACGYDEALNLIEDYLSGLINVKPANLEFTDTEVTSDGV